MALAGPAVNVVIAAVILAYLGATRAMTPVEQLSMTSGSFLARLAAVNVVLVLFNMLPAFPMDGGRELRALLARRMNYSRATKIAARLGQFMALVFGFIGLFSNPFLVFIAFFVWISAAQEVGMVQMKFALEGVPMQRVMITDFRTPAPLDRLSRAAEYVLALSNGRHLIQASRTCPSPPPNRREEKVRLPRCRACAPASWCIRQTGPIHPSPHAPQVPQRTSMIERTNCPPAFRSAWCRPGEILRSLRA